MADTSTGLRRHGLAGARAARTHRTVRLVSLAALATAVVMILALALRPLPRPPVAGVPAIGTPPAAVTAHDSIAGREERLSGLTAAGNVFAPDRQPWAIETLTPGAPALAEASPEPPAPVTSVPPPFTTSGGSVNLAEVVLTELPTAAAKKSRDALTLRGLFVSGSRRIAMIQGGESRRREAVELYEEGEVFSLDTWRLVHIDPDRDRVIIEHLGQGDILELALYDGSAVPLAAVPTDDSPRVLPATEDQARQDLLSAGVSGEDVDAVFDLLSAIARGEDPEPWPPSEPAADAPPRPAVAAAPEAAPRERQPGEPPSMPEGMAELLKSMITDAARRKPPVPEAAPASTPEPK